MFVSVLSLLYLISSKNSAQIYIIILLKPRPSYIHHSIYVFILFQFIVYTCDDLC